MVEKIIAITAVLSLLAYIYFENKKNKQIRIFAKNIIIHLAKPNPTQDDIKEARIDAGFISSTTSGTLAIANPENEARVKAIRASQPKLDKFIKGQEAK